MKWLARYPCHIERRPLRNIEGARFSLGPQCLKQYQPNDAVKFREALLEYSRMQTTTVVALIAAMVSPRTK